MSIFSGYKDCDVHGYAAAAQQPVALMLALRMNYGDRVALTSDRVVLCALLYQNV